VFMEVALLAFVASAQQDYSSSYVEEQLDNRFFMPV